MSPRLALLWTAGMGIAFLVPGSQIQTPSLPFAADKWVHVALFLGFGALWTQARPGRAIWVFVLGTALGIAVEIVQGALPIGRSADPLDAVADVVGLALGIGLAQWSRRRAPSNE